MPSRPPKHQAGTARQAHAPHHDDQRRGTPAERGYDSKWRRAATAYKAKHPLCVECQREGRVTGVFCVDHIVPHRIKEARDSGDLALIERAEKRMWSQSNWQSLCARHHSIKTNREDGGFGRPRREAEFEGGTPNPGREVRAKP